MTVGPIVYPASVRRTKSSSSFITLDHSRNHVKERPGHFTDICHDNEALESGHGSLHKLPLGFAAPVHSECARRRAVPHAVGNRGASGAAPFGSRRAERRAIRREAEEASALHHRL